MYIILIIVFIFFQLAAGVADEDANNNR